MPGVVVANQPGVYLVDADGNAITLTDGSNIGAAEGIIIMGKDGLNARTLRVAADGTLRIDPTGTSTQPVSVAVLPLPTGAATEATLTSIRDFSGIKKINDPLPAGTNNIGDVDVVSSVLPTGAATESTLAAIRDTAGIKKITDPLPAGTNNIGDVDVVSSVLPTGAATEATLATRAADRTTASAPHAVRLSDGTDFITPTTPDDIQPVVVRDGQHNQSAQYTVFGLPKVAQESLLADLRFDADYITNKWIITASEGAGYSSEPGGTAVNLTVAPIAGSKIEFRSKDTYTYESGKGLMLKISIVLGDTGVTGNIREWGLKNDKGDGLFMRMDGTTLKFIHKNQGIETEYAASGFDTLVTADPYGHLWYIQYPWLGVADIFLYYDNEVVHRVPYIGTSVNFSLGNPDMYVFISNENVSNASLVSLKSGCASVFIEGGTAIAGRTLSGNSLSMRVDDYGHILTRLVDATGQALALEDAPGGAALRVFDGDVRALIQQVLNELRMIRMQLSHATEVRFDHE